MILYRVPTKVPYHPFNYRMAAAIFIRVVSMHGKSDYALLDETTYSAAWWKTVELALLPLKRYEIEEKVNDKVVEHNRFSTKRHLIIMNAKNRTLKMHICLFAASETGTSRNLKERRKYYLSDEKRDPSMAQWYSL
ncbi:hypothetical protein AVEN_187036-1 [Araneus ventricosus]|uniref:Uncharacterized protein n=1 Tax=Araneus ventricosus TaxID=182803 RepID=A0A4Y2HBF4_ARAVE|nr:hypothetical protein AVEN_187036-1 [Araneus ventricosus]